jgi:hypothetical protein
MPSRRVRHAGGYLRDESPDRSRGRQDVELGIAGVFGDRLPEYRTAAAAIHSSHFQKSARSGDRRMARQAQRNGEKSRNTMASAACSRTSMTSFSWYCGCSSRQRRGSARAPGSNGQAVPRTSPAGAAVVPGAASALVPFGVKSRACRGFVHTAIPARRAEGRRRAGSIPLS